MNLITRITAALLIFLAGVAGTATAASAAPYVSRDDAALQQEARDSGYYGPGQSATVKIVCLKSDWPWRKVQWTCYKVRR